VIDDEEGALGSLQSSVLRESLAVKGIGKVRRGDRGTRQLREDTELQVSGTGAFGKEGGSLGEFFRSTESLASISIDGVRPRSTSGNGSPGLDSTESVDDSDRSSLFAPLNISKEKIVLRTYGPGKTRKHPWTSREDGGINSRSADGKIRESEIYYAGIIDILQQYNNVKRVENFFKGFTHDRSQLSAVPAENYAERFIKFMDDNID
jgi:Phosphatidylinositol-4-phosphate 5-Kinase